VGPAVEAFGFGRIIFGSSRPRTSQAASNSGDWYNVARESLAELGVEQEPIDLVFSLNAQKVYASK
jgi:predicted TIM-barrel fold metal-dependent hydrolase